VTRTCKVEMNEPDDSASFESSCRATIPHQTITCTRDALGSCCDRGRTWIFTPKRGEPARNLSYHRGGAGPSPRPSSAKEWGAI
jgi:hypothetical protein